MKVCSAPVKLKVTVVAACAEPVERRPAHMTALTAIRVRAPEAHAAGAGARPCQAEAQCFFFLHFFFFATEAERFFFFLHLLAAVPPPPLPPMP